MAETVALVLHGRHCLCYLISLDIYPWQRRQIAKCEAGWSFKNQVDLSVARVLAVPPVLCVTKQMCLTNFCYCGVSGCQTARLLYKRNVYRCEYTLEPNDVVYRCHKRRGHKGSHASSYFIWGSDISSCAK